MNICQPHIDQIVNFLPASALERGIMSSRTIVLHVHNFWHSLTDAAGRLWILRHLLTLPFRRADERGDRYYRYRGLPNMFLHTFSRRELIRLVRRAGFRVEHLIPLQSGGGAELPRRWFFGGIRANGWVVVCRRPEDS